MEDLAMAKVPYKTALIAGARFWESLRFDCSEPAGDDRRQWVDFDRSGFRAFGPLRTSVPSGQISPKRTSQLHLNPNSAIRDGRPASSASRRLSGHISIRSARSD